MSTAWPLADDTISETDCSLHLHRRTTLAQSPPRQSSASSMNTTSQLQFTDQELCWLTQGISSTMVDPERALFFTNRPLSPEYDLASDYNLDSGVDLWSGEESEPFTITGFTIGSCDPVMSDLGTSSHHAMTGEEAYPALELIDWPAVPEYKAQIPIVTTKPVDSTTSTAEPELWQPEDLHQIGFQDDYANWRCKHGSCTADKVFSRACDLRKHYRSHIKSFFCDESDCMWSVAGFSNSKDYRRHKQSHNPQFRCSAPGCNRRFGRAGAFCRKNSRSFSLRR